MNEAPLDRRALERVLLPSGTGPAAAPGGLHLARRCCDWEQRHLFAGSWVCVGPRRRRRAAGRPEGRAGRPGLASCSCAAPTAVLRAFWNVCRHRAHELLQSGECTNDRARPLPVPRLELRARRLAAPFGEVEPRARLRPERRGPAARARPRNGTGFVFVNPSGDAPALRRMDRRPGRAGRALPDGAAARGGVATPTRSRPTGSSRWRTTTSATTARASTPSSAG